MVSTTCPKAPNPAAVILTSRLPPGTTDGAAKDRDTLGVCAFTGLTTNNSNATKAAAATTNNANTFPIMAVPFTVLWFGNILDHWINRQNRA